MTYHSAERVSSRRAIVTLQQLQIKVLSRFTSQGYKIKFKKFKVNRKMGTFVGRSKKIYSNLEGGLARSVLHQCTLQL
jgi:hypothetical protein